MTRKTSFRVLLAGAVLCAASLGAWQIYSPAPDAAPPKVQPQALDSIGEQNRARLEQLRAELQHQRLAAATKPAGNSAYPAALIAEMKDEMKLVAAARTMFNRDELIRAELERAKRDPNQVALAVELASSWRLATELFGDDQAQARVYSLHLLRHLAENGDLKAVETAVDRIGTALNEEDKWVKGIEHDYVDALAVYLRSIGLDRFIADPAAYYDRMHLSERTSIEVEKAFYDSGILRGAPEPALKRVREFFFTYLGQEPPRG